MEFTSTRKKQDLTSAQAIAKGLSTEGGLYMPKDIPLFSKDEIGTLINSDYITRAVITLGKFLTDFTSDEIRNMVIKAYSGNFDNNEPAPLHDLNNSLSVLELWHGPTCAFKDMALQLLPHLLTNSAKKIEDDKTIVVLVATSGDTGKAALEGFKDVENTKIIVFYPVDGVSTVQKRQMNTQEGDNVYVCAIEGNFDDAQTGVKNIFSNKEIKELLNSNNMEFSSANSINFGRLVPQIVYYVSAYCDLIKSGKIALDQTFNVVVPTGNFGNILAAYFAKKMGIPVGKLICASNQNKVLTDFINTGEYNRNREFFTTSSPSMDILISSNLERLLFMLTDGNEEAVCQWMHSLNNEGIYKIDENTMKKLQSEFFGGYCDDIATKKVIKETFDKYNYLLDTHTAVAVKVYEDYIKETNDNTTTVIVSTASPYKFTNDVLDAFDETDSNISEFDKVKMLSEKTNTKIPDPLIGLQNKEVLHKTVIKKTQMDEFIKSVLGI